MTQWVENLTEWLGSPKGHGFHPRPCAVGYRIQHCCNCSSESTPGLGTSTCCGLLPFKKKKKKVYSGKSFHPSLFPTCIPAPFMFAPRAATCIDFSSIISFDSSSYTHTHPHACIKFLFRDKTPQLYVSKKRLTHSILMDGWLIFGLFTVFCCYK